MANASLNATLINSNVQVGGSPEADVQVIVIDPPLVGFAEMDRVRAEAKGATSMRRLINLKNILNGGNETKMPMLKMEENKR